MMKVSRLDHEAIDIVFNNISSRSKDEIYDLGMNEDVVREHFKNVCHLPFSATLCDNDGNPLAVIIVEYIRERLYRADIISSEGAWDVIGTHITHLLARISSDIISQCQYDIEAFSPHYNNKWVKWFRVMGFEYDNEELPGIHRYVKRWR
jgi:hypothetical protein